MMAENIMIMKRIAGFFSSSLLVVAGDVLKQFVCQEQIELSGFVARELSAFSVLGWMAI
jgi:nitrogen regulatory protein PII-like uncharacterized protein